MRKLRGILSFLVGTGLIVASMSNPAQANNSWNGYHWARTADPFPLKLGDNVGSAWDAALVTASSDWTQSVVLDTTVVPGTVTNLRRCTLSLGRVEVCNTSYGFTGWLGVAGISVSGGHIVSGYVKLNDSYFDTPSYNKPEWRALVACQEVGHTLGLDHQDEAFDNPNLGTCMDYTSDPLGPPDNEHPNQHDYDELQIIYTHLDATNSYDTGSSGGGGGGNGHGKPSRSRQDAVDANGNGTVTWTLWTN